VTVALAIEGIIPSNTARQKKVPNSPVGRNFCLTQEETPRTKTNAHALITKIPNIIWSPVVLGALHDSC
jgi:hypothetical protein